MKQPIPSAISAIIITLNEEKNIERCLKSLDGVADEIIVIDSFSTDKTQELCEKYGARFIQHRWPGINAQRNYSLQFATHDYVLSLDADEVLSDGLRQRLLALKLEGFSDDGYVFNRMTQYCGRWIRHSGWYPDKKLRLFHKEKGVYKGQDPHDTVVLNAGAKSSRVKEDIRHYSYHSIEEHLTQMNTFTTVAAQGKFEKGKKVVVLWHLVLYPLWTFFRTYIVKLGILDGYQGFVISTLDIHYKFSKYIKLKELNRRAKFKI